MSVTRIVEANPYPWPFDGAPDLSKTALLVSLDSSWRSESEVSDNSDENLGYLARGLADAGALVIGYSPSIEALEIGTFTEATVEFAKEFFKIEKVIFCSSGNGFFSTNLDGILRSLGVTDLLFGGWGLEGPVHSTMRSANDLGYECLLISDGVVGLDPAMHEPSCSMIQFSGGIFGAVARCSEIAELYGTTAANVDQSNESGCSISEQEPLRANRYLTRESLGKRFESEQRELLVEAQPYNWPFDDTLDPKRTALICIDWQVDFCGPGGYVDRMGYDLSLTRAPLKPTAAVLNAARKWGCMVVHTREGHRPDLSDCPPTKLWRSKRIGAGIGDPGPCGRVLVRGEPGWEIVPEVSPIEGEVIIDKPGKGSFYATDLDLILRTAGITHIVLTGITTDVCVHTTLRDANDRGYECLLLSDCTGATDIGNYEAALKMVTMQGGVFGAIATSDAFLAAIGVVSEVEVKP